MQFDQHFLEDDTILTLTVDSAQISADDKILEIGCGPGFLTEKLIETPTHKITGLEIDKKFKLVLHNLSEISDALEIKMGNALELIDDIEFNKVVANIPYSITEPLYEKLLENNPQRCVLLQGKKFYDLCLSEDSKWKYFVQAFYDITLLAEVPGEKFTPSTKVMSALVLLEKKEKPTQEDLFFWYLFSKRKRSVENALLFTLVDTYNLPKKEAKKKLEGVELPDKQLWMLSNKEFKELILPHKP